MLVFLAELLTKLYSGFNVFSYLTLRAILGLLTALFIALLIGPGMIRRLSFHQIGQQVRARHRAGIGRGDALARDAGAHKHLPEPVMDHCVL